MAVDIVALGIYLLSVDHVGRLFPILPQRCSYPADELPYDGLQRIARSSRTQWHCISTLIYSEFEVLHQYDKAPSGYLQLKRIAFDSK